MDALNSACQRKKAIKFDDLPLGDYKVKEFKFVSTKFGQRITVIFGDFFVWLPPRFINEVKSDEQLIILNEKAAKNNFYMKYDGKDLSNAGFVMLSFYEA